ncbi:MAG: FGGY-family carbohydrate kinase [Opitutae bacterium]|nr:FGGY-family carbohydrate kinase [Opitutae bacterium]
MALLLGIDLGTSYFKVGLFDAHGALRGLGRVAVGRLSPAPGWSELPVAEFWRLLRQALADALAQAGAGTGDIAGVSYSSQANTFVLLDRHDEPLTPLVIWNDRRAHPVDRAVEEFGRSDKFRDTVGFCGLAAEFAPVKWRWYQRHAPAVWARTARVMTVSDYLTFALTGEPAGDASTAAITGVYSTIVRDWWREALEFFAVPPARLSRPMAPGTPCGRTGRRAADWLGLPPGVRFAVGALDHHAAACGAGLDRPDDASISIGTVLAVLTLVERIKPVAGCFHGPHGADRFYRLAFDPAGANQLEDYQRQFAPDLSMAQLAAFAANALSSITPESAAGEDISRRHGTAVRRLMEQISATHRMLLRQVRGSRPVHRVFAMGGGARSDAWLQIYANMFAATVVAPKCHEPACLGAAAFAAVAAGVHPSLGAALGVMVQPERVMEPQPSFVTAYRLAYPETGARVPPGP